MKTILRLLSPILFCLFYISAQAQMPPTPTILEVTEDDRAAVIYWNSKTQNYDLTYDPDKQQGIYSYVVEWGTVAAGFTEKEVTPYRAFQPQPLTPNVLYQARVFALDSDGRKSLASSVVQFQHSDVKVNDMRNRLNGFFDDFNQPMGAFDETKWNQAYSGCDKPGYVSQHINNQFHAHNVLASDGFCDRGVASSRPREIFDFQNRTGIIEFDMDGAKNHRQRWYLDITPATKKNDLTGHITIEDSNNPPVGDPEYLLRLSEFGRTIKVQLADQNGALHTLQNAYRNGACGGDLRYCPGNNLVPVPNVRKHWRIELSKTDVRIFVEGVLVVDASLQTSFEPNGLPYEEAQLNWIFFSYNTAKDNLPLSMVHWDNFGFDAPAGWTNPNVVHNYTDGKLGTDVVSPNGPPNGTRAMLNTPAAIQIPIPDPIQDNANNWPLSTELMFTLQSRNYYWTANDYITVNGHSYNFPKPTSNIPGFPDNRLVGTHQPYSAILDIDPAHLVTGNNEVRFHLNNAQVLNIHIELLFPKSQAPVFTQPGDIFSGYLQTLMEFRNHYNSGPGLLIREVDGSQIWTSEFQKVLDNTNHIDRMVKQTPVSGIIDIDVITNSNAQLIASAHAAGIEYYDVMIDSQVFDRVYLNIDEPVAASRHTYSLNTGCLSNGVHEFFIFAYDVNGRASVFDLFENHMKSGRYVPIEITVANSATQPQLDVQLWLEGTYTVGAEMTTSLNTKELLPKQQPFNRMPWNYVGTEEVISFDADVVDWVLVSLRSGIERSTEVSRFAALLLKSGQLVDVGGCAPQLSVSAGAPLYIAVYHQNHLNVMSPVAVPFVDNQLSYDFRAANSYVLGSGQKEVAPGVWALFSGNGDQETPQRSRDINGEDHSNWSVNNGLFNLYTPWDYNLDGDINGMDRILWGYNSGVFTGVD